MRMPTVCTSRTSQTLDEDSSHTHTYSLVYNPGQRFAIVNNSLYTSATANLNYEAQQQWVRIWVEYRLIG